MKLFVQVLVVVSLVAGKGARSQSQPPATQDSPATEPDQSLSPDEQAAQNARYYFSSDVDDQISDLRQHRDEQRDGLKVKGSYSYSDGFFWRKVVYEADENGYRIVSDEMVPLDGPHGDPAGSASVHTVADGAETNYTLTTPQKRTETRDSSKVNETLTTPTLIASAPEYRT